MIKIDDLIITQAGLRNRDQLEDMIDFVANGGVFTQSAIYEYVLLNPEAHKSRTIRIARFPDGELYLADGHHRVLAIYKAGRDYIRADEYHIVDWTYHDYDCINYKVKWVTPYDPRHRIRLDDFLDFKKEVYEILEESREEATKFIRASIDRYSEPRRDRKHITDLEKE